MNTRRTFLKSVASVTAGVSLTGSGQLLAGNLFSSSGGSTKRKIHVFSKNLHWLNYAEMAVAVKKIGFDGIDLTVRTEGHVIPEQVKSVLPEVVKIIRDQGLIIDRITTAITDAEDPLTGQILETAAKLGIRNYRMGWLNYEENTSVKEYLKQINPKLRKLAELNRKLGITGAYQNHAGPGIGGAVWDMAVMLEGIDPKDLGIRYDIRHATAEGGTSWPVNLDFVSGHINSLDIKDFIWKKINGTWQPYNVPLGEGMVDFQHYFKLINTKNIQGDFTMHFEYELGGADTGSKLLSVAPEVVLTAMKRDLAVLRNWENIN